MAHQLYLSPVEINFSSSQGLQVCVIHKQGGVDGKAIPAAIGNVSANLSALLNNMA